MKAFLKTLTMENHKNQVSIETQMILTRGVHGSILTETSLTVPVVIKIGFPQSWSTCLIRHVADLEFRSEFLLVSDVKRKTGELVVKEGRAILMASPLI